MQLDKSVDVESRYMHCRVMSSKGIATSHQTAYKQVRRQHLPLHKLWSSKKPESSSVRTHVCARILMLQMCMCLSREEKSSCDFVQVMSLMQASQHPHKPETNNYIPFNCCAVK